MLVGSSPAVAATAVGAGRSLRTCEQPRGELPSRVGSEWVERQSDVTREPTAPRRTRREELRTRQRQQQQRHVLRARRERLQQVQQALVGPVDVLEEEQRRPAACECFDQDARGEKQRFPIRNALLSLQPDKDRQV